MDAKELQAKIGKPLIARLKVLGEGLRVGTMAPKRLLVKPVTPFTVGDRLEAEGILVLPEDAKEQSTPPASTGIVVKLGEGAAGWIEEGDMIMFGAHAGKRFFVEGAPYIVLDDLEVMCVLEETEGSRVEIKVIS